MTQKPYYEDAWVTIYHGDCRDVLPALPRVDVIVTDPPYGIGLVTKTSDYRDSEAFDDGESLRASKLYDDDPERIRGLIGEVMPVLLAKADRCVVFPGPAMLFAYPEPNGFGGVYNPAGAGRSPWGFQCLSPVLFYGKDPYLADGKGGRPNAMRDEQPNTEKVDHPCPKPVKWMRWAIVRASREGETILDPFMGSGTTLIAAKELGRKSIGIEVEERYCELAVARLSQQTLGLSA